MNVSAPWTREQVEAWVTLEDEWTARDLASRGFGAALMQAWRDVLRTPLGRTP